MLKQKRMLSFALALLLLVANLGCPEATGPGGDPDEIDFAFELSALKGFGLIWYRDQPINNPNTITLGPFPNDVQFNGFPAWAGTFAINSDFRGDNEFTFNVVRNGSNQEFAFVDFSGDGVFNGVDIPMIWNGSNRMFTVNNPFGARTIAAGANVLTLSSRVLSLRGEAQNGFELPLRMTRGSMNWNWTLFVASNRLYYPQIASGVSGDLRVLTRVPTTNPNGTALDLTFNAFSDSGSPLAISRGSASFTATIGPKLSRTFEIASEGALQTGYLEASGSHSFTSAADFRTVRTMMRSPQSLESTPQQSEELVGEAGITASRLSTSHLLEVKKAGDDNTAFAVVNPTSKDLALKFTLKDRNNQIVKQKTTTLRSKHKTAQFFLEAVDMQSTSSFEGTLQISADGSIAVTILNTFKGVQSSSIESASALNR